MGDHLPDTSTLCSLFTELPFGPQHSQLQLDLFPAFESCHAEFTDWLWEFQVCNAPTCTGLVPDSFLLAIQLGSSQAPRERKRWEGTQWECGFIMVRFFFSP